MTGTSAVVDGAPLLPHLRAALAHLADVASSVDASCAYERVLLTLDISTPDSTLSASEGVAFDDRFSAIELARRSLSALRRRHLSHLQVELLLALLDDAVMTDLG